MVKFDPELNRYEDRWRKWAEEDPNLVKLRNKLLSIDGDAVVPNREPDLQKLLLDGEKIEHQKTRLHEMRSSKCHYNTAVLYNTEDSDLVNKIGTGWALTKDDGLWRQHSWGMNSDIIIETTVKRDIYYGIILDGNEAENFVSKNI